MRKILLTFIVLGTCAFLILSLDILATAIGA